MSTIKTIEGEIVLAYNGLYNKNMRGHMGK